MSSRHGSKFQEASRRQLRNSLPPLLSCPASVNSVLECKQDLLRDASSLVASPSLALLLGLDQRTSFQPRMFRINIAKLRLR